MRTRRKVRWWSRRERLPGGGNTFIVSWLVLLPELCGAQVWSFSSSLTPSTVLEGSSMHRWDGMGWDGAFAYLNRCSSQICAGDPHPRAG